MAVMINKVGVIGSGQMGNGIAHVAALAGLNVVLNDISEDRLKSAMATINGNLSRQVVKKIITEDARKGALDADRYRRNHGRSRRLRPGDRERGREGRGQAQDFPRSVRGAEAGSHRRLQHVFDFDHAAGRLHRPPRESSSAFTS